MSEQFKNSLVTIWLLVSAACMTLPVFLPSNGSSLDPTTNVVGAATVTMFILSFPSSLFGIPLIVFIDYSLGVDPNSIAGRYLNMFLLFVLGSAQWFWVLPRVWQREPAIQVLTIPALADKDWLSEGTAEEGVNVLDDRQRTPVERVISPDRE